MRALVIIAHGSRRVESNEEVTRLAEQVRKKSDAAFHTVRHAFLELAEPDLLSVIDELIENRINDVTILPYFLNSGNHVSKDIPALLRAAEKQYPHCSFKLAAAIGMYDGMPDLILHSVSQA